MRIVGQKVIIRDLSFNDSDDFHKYASDPNVGPNAGWQPTPNEEVSRRLLSGQIISKDVYAISLESTNKLIGTISLYRHGLRKNKYAYQLGFSLSSLYWNNGYMTEAVNLMIDYVFTKTECKVLEVGHHSDNYGSKRVIEKCGFNYDGRLCMYKQLYDGRVIDADFYSMTKEEYERKKRL